MFAVNINLNHWALVGLDLTGCAIMYLDSLSVCFKKVPLPAPCLSLSTWSSCHACSVMVLAVKVGNCARLTPNWLLQHPMTDKLIENINTWLQNEMSYVRYSNCSRTCSGEHVSDSKCRKKVQHRAIACHPSGF